MHLLGPSLLLLGYLVFSDSTYNAWTFKHPKTLYAWDGACVWIPCTYSSLKGSGHILDNLTVYHNFTYNKTAKNYVGTVLYSKNLTTEESTSSQERVRFLGNRRNNCTLLINPVRVDDSGLLGLRVMSRTDKWMASLNLSISERAPQPHIELPQEIREDQEVTATCSLNFACHDYQIHLRWSLEGTVTTSTILSTETVTTQSSLHFQPNWTHDGKNLTCQLWDPMKKWLLSEKTVLLEVKCESPQCSCGRDEGPVISSPPRRGMGAQRRKRDGSVGSRRWEWSRQSCGTSSIFPIISAGVSGYGFMLASASQVALTVKNPPGQAGDIRDAALIPGSGRSPGGGHGNPLQNSYLENPPGQRSLTGYSPWGHKELDTTKATEHAHMPVKQNKII